MLLLKGPFSYEKMKEKEWLVANGLGGYASSTVIGANTRKYHGLLVAAKNPPVERRLLLSKFEETARIAGQEYALSTNKYPGAVYPKGYENLISFSLSPFPTFEYALGRARLRKTVFMLHKKNATAVRYEIESRDPVELTVYPLVNERDFHGNTTSKIDFSQRAEAHETRIMRDGALSLLLESDSFAYSVSENWYGNMLYELETARGEGDSDNQFCPGAFRRRFEGKEDATIIATDGEKVPGNCEELYNSELARMKRLREGVSFRVPELLVYAADSFMVGRKSTSSSTIIAGYHWFADWGRDSMIALPGLAIATRKFDFARSVLDTFAQNVKNGLIPNVFSDSGTGAAYNSADASLWFIVTSYEYLERSGDEKFFSSKLWGPVKEIVAAYRNGTSGVWMDADNLISCGPGLTWMDAFVDGRAVTPRNGKPVEINALWYNALEMTHELAGRFGEKKLENETRELADLTRKNFSKFWNSKKNCLYDTLDPLDGQTRPNQIFALSLPFGVLEKEKEGKVFELVKRELFTPYGLKSLSSSESNYRGKYAGDRRTRDNAYHNGTVWSWLIGPYADACSKIDGKKKADRLVEPLKEFVGNNGMGTVPELFEADTLEPRGCFSQAWGVAEWLRVIIEYGSD